jgi:hypothetical protein
MFVYARPCYQTDRNLTNMVHHLGYESISGEEAHKAFLEGEIRSDKQVVQDMIDRLGKTQLMPDSSLTSRERADLELARAMARSFPGTGPIRAANIPPASDMVERTAGTYEFGSAKINLDPKMLNTGADTIAVMTHELGHHISQAEDLTEGHRKGIDRVVDIVVQNIATGKYDDYIQRVKW